MRRDPRSSLQGAALLGAALVLSLVLVACNSQSPSYTLVWQDNFDGPAGAPPDPNYWTFDVGGGGWGNAQLEFDTARPQNVSLDGQGHLAITALKEAYQGRDYTSARIVTRGLFEQSLGKYEARIRLPVGQGIWPAFWMLGANYESVGWPTCGEIDIMEERGQEPSVVNGSMHGPGYSGGRALTAPYVCQPCSNPPCTPGCPFDTDFHVFAVQVETDRVTFAVDGSIYEQVTRDQQDAGTAWPFNQNFFLILNVAVGGTYVGAPDVTTTFPQTMLVDYVRYYKPDP